jgi:hypothetical protein
MDDEEKEKEVEPCELVTEEICDNSVLVEAWDSATTEYRVRRLKISFLIILISS